MWGECKWLLPKVEVWNWKEDCITEKEEEGHFLFNDALNTFYIFKPCLFRFTFSLTCFKSFCNLLPIHFVYFRSEISFYRQTLTSGKNLRERERNVLFNDALNTFYIFKPCLFRFTFSLTCFKSFYNLLPIHFVYFRSEISFYRHKP